MFMCWMIFTLNTFKFMFMYRNILLENKKGKVGGYTLIQKRKRRKKFVNFIEEIVRLGKDNTSKMSIFEYSRFYLVLIFIQLIDCMVDFDQGIAYIAIRVIKILCSYNLYLMLPI